MPSTPRSPIFGQRSGGNWLLRSIPAARGAISSRANCCTVARSMSIVSPRWKFSDGKLIIGVSSLVALAVHDHQCLLHDRNQRVLAAVLRVHFAARDRERAAGLHDEAL